MRNAWIEDRFSCYLYRRSGNSILEGRILVDWGTGGTTIMTPKGYADKLLERFRRADIPKIVLDREVAEGARLGIGQREGQNCFYVHFNFTTTLDRKQVRRALKEAGFSYRKPRD